MSKFHHRRRHHQIANDYRHRHRHRHRSMNWQLASLGGLVTLIASILFGHAWVISDYLIHPGCCSDLLPSRSDLPQYVRMIPGDMEAELSLPVEQLAFDSLDDPSNHARGKSLAGWLIPAEGSDR